MTTHAYMDRRQNNTQRVAVLVVCKWRVEMGAYRAARFLRANDVPLPVALRVITGRTE